MPQQYFFLSSAYLAPDSVIQPGNWGRILGRYQSPKPNAPTFGDLGLVARELVFEMVRGQSFPGRPSRLAAAFCCPSLADLNAYRLRVDPIGFQLAYLVELADPEKPTHIAPLLAVDYAPETPFIEETTNRAHVYWRGDPQGPQEVVTLSPLRILAVA